MTRSGAAAPVHAQSGGVANLVWVDARQAIVLHWEGGSATVRHLESDVPSHHHSTGHVRHEPFVGGPGAGSPRSAGETHRLEHLARFVDHVAAAVPTAGDVLVVGPGTVHERLAERLRALDAHDGADRKVDRQASGPRTERQLIARLRDLAGAPPRRRARPNPFRAWALVRRASGALGRVARRPFDRDARRRPLAGTDEEVEETPAGGDLATFGGDG